MDSNTTHIVSTEFGISIMLNIERITSQNESEFIDFKREFHKSNAKLLHDILCLSNSFYEGDRFIAFGVANDKTVYGIPSRTGYVPRPQGFS